LLVTDIDGTLLNKKGEIAPRDRAAVQRLLDAGISVSVSTGRAIKASAPVLAELGLGGYHVYFDGALVADPFHGHEVYVEPLSPEVVRETVEFARKNGPSLELFTTTGYYSEHESWSTRIRHEFFHIDATIGDLSGIWKSERIIKETMVVLQSEDKAKARAFAEHFKDRLIFTWTTTPAYPDADFVNVLTPTVSKGRALKALADFKKIPLSHIAVIGDGVNDIPMLKEAGLSIAMGNAPANVKAAANRVTIDVEECGFAAAIEQLLSD
jgi:5-amino-6-(5-phospho-D-ribitylamino)uracil phosphatase